MKGQRKLIFIVAAIAAILLATGLVNRKLTQSLEEAYGVEYKYYDMGEVVPFEEDYQTYGVSLLDGYSMRIDKAEVMTTEEFFAWTGYTDQSVAALLGENIQWLPEKLCVLTVTFFNEDCDAQGFYLDNFSCNNDTYAMNFDSTLTVLANDFLMNANETDISSGFVGNVGNWLGHDEEVTLYMVYDYIKFYFDDVHWENLTEDTLQFMVTWFPTEKLVNMVLE